MATSDFFQSSSLYLVGGIVFVALMIMLLRKESMQVRLFTDKLILEFPLIGPLLRKLEISRFCATLSALYGSGVTIIPAVRMSGEVVSNFVISQSTDRAVNFLKEGRDLHVALNDTGEFNSVVIQMISIGEESGDLSQVLNQVVEFYDQDVEDGIDTITSMIEPLLTVILALVIVWIAAAVFGPIYSSFENMEF